MLKVEGGDQSVLATTKLVALSLKKHSEDFERLVVRTRFIHCERTFVNWLFCFIRFSSVRYEFM